MALLPLIPPRPADRPETWPEYLRRRATIAMHRQALDDMAVWLKQDPLQIAAERQEMFRRQLRTTVEWRKVGILQNVDLECRPTWSTGRFQGYYLSDAERRRLEGQI